MPLIELPRALEDYFAFAETDATRRGRRFSISFAYRQRERIERLQWWYHVTPAQEALFEGHGIATFRQRAIARFCRHIERWLEITQQQIHSGKDSIPCVNPVAVETPAVAATTVLESTAEILTWPLEKVANAS
jgi:hypothetical protein